MNEQQPIDNNQNIILNNSEVTEIESLCMNCYKQGHTKLLLIEIPFFRNVLVSNFQCNHCNYENSQIQQTTPIQDHGLLIKLKVENVNDLSRQIVKSDYASINFPEIGFEIPSTAQASCLNTLEGFIINSLSAMIYVYNQLDPNTEDAQKILNIINKLNEMKEVKEPFIIELDDPSGNSFLQNLNAPKSDPQLIYSNYIRSFEQNKFIGLIAENQNEITPTNLDDKNSNDLVPLHKNTNSVTSGLPKMIDQSVIPSSSDIVEIDEMCQSCHHTSKLKIMVTQIPYFKEVSIIAFSCDYCGYRTNEIKCGGMISSQAKKITLKPSSIEDLSRSFLKSDTATVRIPEIGLELEPGTLGSKFTTIEGFIKDIIINLENLPFFHGDSTEESDENKLQSLIKKLKEITELKIPFSFVVDDLLANSYIQNPFIPEVDPYCTEENYDRSFEQNEELGINNMNVN